MQIITQTIKVKGRKAVDYILKHDWLFALVVAASIILLAVLFGWENNKVVLANPDPAAHLVSATHSGLGFLSNWDGPDYLRIAKTGYQYPIQANFFPLYPLLVHTVNLIVNSSLRSALLVSWASFAGAIYYYLKIIKRLFKVKSNQDALSGVLLFALFPTGIFLIATYTESLFAVLALGALYFGLQKRYTTATVLALLATATHINGLFVVVLLCLLALEQKAKISRLVSIIIGGSLGLLAYMLYLQVHFHNAFEFVASQKSHGWLQYSYADFATEIASINGLFFLLVAISVIYWWQRRRIFSIYSLLYIAIALLGGLGGFGRYALMAFPIQFMLYDQFRSKKNAVLILIALSAISWTYFTLQYAGGYVGG